MADEITQQDRYRGALLGLACGDAVGTTLEFKPPGSFAPISDMVGGGPFELEPGQWTDDTSMALCLAVSLVEQGGFDPADQMQRYVRWYREGYLSSNGVCFDIGNTVSAALRRFERSGEPYSGATDPYSAGNGSIMRLAPLPLAFAATPARASDTCMVQKSPDGYVALRGDPSDRAPLIARAREGEAVVIQKDANGDQIARGAWLRVFHFPDSVIPPATSPEHKKGRIGWMPKRFIDDCG